MIKKSVNNFIFTIANFIYSIITFTSILLLLYYIGFYFDTLGFLEKYFWLNLIFRIFFFGLFFFIIYLILIPGFSLLFSSIFNKDFKKRIALDFTKRKLIIKNNENINFGT